MKRTNKELEIYDKIKSILICSSKPSVEIVELINNGFFESYPFKMITDLKNINQNLMYHKEGNVFNHTMLVIDKAAILRAKSENKLVLMLSALLHDLGKLTTTKVSKNGKITSYNHDKASSKLVNEFLNGFESEEIIKEVFHLTNYHMQSLYYQHKSNLFNEIGIIKDVDINDLYLLTVADRTGRLGVDEENEMANIQKFISHIERKK